MFVCLLVCLFFILIILEHPQEYTLKISSRLDLIWQRYIGFLKMFIYLFVCFFVYYLFFCLNPHGTPTGSFPEIFMEVWLYLAEIFRIKKCLIVCLFVCLFVELFVFYFNHPRTPTGIYPENFVKIPLDLAEIFRI